MTDEEKKAIEWLKNGTFFSQRKFAPTILNLIENQQKEIDNLKEINSHLKFLYDDSCKCLVDSIPKSKIEEKLEIAISIRDNYLEKCKEHILIPIYNERIKVYKELLESEE